MSAPSTLNGPNRPDLGQNGSKVIADTNPNIGGDWFCIDVLSDAVFTTLTGNMTGVGSTSFPAGTQLFGRFTAITLSSGSVIAYNA
jgi:hypothetical protein